MKTRLLTLGMAGMLTLTTYAGFIYSGTSGYIPDGSPVGWSATAEVSGLASPISSVSVNLNISGGYNGDLYAYLSYGGVLVPLLNRVGVGVTSGDAFGYGTAGMRVTLADGYLDIHDHDLPSPTSQGTYSADGRNISPLSAPNTLYAASPRLAFSAFDDKNPNGTWTLFFADLSAGGQSHLDSWSLSVNEVPEPANVALGVFAGIFLVVTLVRSRGVRSWLHRRRVAVVEWINAV